jgi:hypothetical protein
VPYKDKKKQAEYLRKYRTPYMKEYRQFKSEQQRKLQEAIIEGNINMAREILKAKPSIDIFEKGRKRTK